MSHCMEWNGKIMKLILKFIGKHVIVTHLGDKKCLCFEIQKKRVAKSYV